MPINNCDIVVFDFETGGVTKDCQVIQVAGKAINGRTLQPYPGPEGEFVSLMRPTDFRKLEKRALEINKKTVEELEKAPEQEVVWRQFCNWVGSFRKSKYIMDGPIPAGQNIVKFDLPIAERLCKQYGLCWDAKKEEMSLFNPGHDLDLKRIAFLWFENLPEPHKYSMDAFREFFGMKTATGEQTHDALTDCRQSGELLLRFMKVHRNLAPRISFKQACSGAA